MQMRPMIAFPCDNYEAFLVTVTSHYDYHEAILFTVTSHYDYHKAVLFAITPQLS